MPPKEESHITIKQAIFLWSQSLSHAHGLCGSSREKDFSQNPLMVGHFEGPLSQETYFGKS